MGDFAGTMGLRNRQQPLTSPIARRSAGTHSMPALPGARPASPPAATHAAGSRHDSPVGARASQGSTPTLPSPAGARSPQGSPSRMRPATSLASIRPVEGPIAGYVPTTSQFSETAMAEAVEIAKDSERLRQFLGDELVQKACKSAGVSPRELKPRPLSDFRCEPGRPAVALSKRQQRRRWEHNEERRTHKLAIVITAYDTMNAEAGEDHDFAGRVFMKEVLTSAMERERRRMERINRDRVKFQSVIERENDLLLQRRKEFEEREREMQQRAKRIEMQQQRSKEEQLERARKHSDTLATVQRTREEQVERWRAEAEQKMMQRDIRVTQYLDEKQSAHQRMRESESERETRRKQTRGAYEQAMRERRQSMQATLRQKAEHVEFMRRRRQTEMRQEQEERLLRAQSRSENAQRIRREQEYRKQLVKERLDATYERMDLMAELKVALDVQRDHDKHDEIIRRDDWRDRTTLQRNITPGPGEYIAKSELDAKGGSWSRYTPKSDVDWMMYHAKQIPGPGQYCVENPYPIKGGSWSRYSPKSDLDWMIHRASQLPGPGTYEPPRDPTKHVRPPGMSASRGSGASVGAIRFSNVPRVSDVDLLIRRASEMPGPGAYDPPIMPREPRSLQQIREHVVQRASRSPTPTRVSTAFGRAQLDRTRAGESLGRADRRTQSATAQDRQRHGEHSVGEAEEEEVAAGEEGLAAGEEEAAGSAE